MFRILKRNAKLALKGNWTAAVLITLTVILVASLFAVLEQTTMRLFVIEPLQANPTMNQTVMSYGEFVRYIFTYKPVETAMTAGFALLSLLLLAPLSLGVTHWHYSLVREKHPTFSDCFYFFENGRRYWRSVWYHVLVSLKCTLWSIPFFVLPGGLMGASVYYYTIGETLTRNQKAAATMGIVLAAALMLLAAVLYSIFVNRYALAPYLLCEEDGRSARAALRESVRSTKGYRASFFLFGLSYLAWVLLVPFTLGLICLFLLPYMNAGMAMYARYIVEKTCSERIDTEERTREFNPAEDAEDLPEAQDESVGTVPHPEPPAPGSGGQASPAIGFGGEPVAGEDAPGVPSQPVPPQGGAQPPTAAPGRVPPPWEVDRAERERPTPRPAAIPWPQEVPPAAPAPEEIRPISPLPEGTQPVSPAPEGIQPISAFPEGTQPVSPAPEGIQPISPLPERPQPISPAPEGIRPISPLPAGTQPVPSAPEETRPIPPLPVRPQPISPAPEGIQPAPPASADGEPPMDVE